MSLDDNFGYDGSGNDERGGDSPNMLLDDMDALGGTGMSPAFDIHDDHPDMDVEDRNHQFQPDHDALSAQQPHDRIEQDHDAPQESGTPQATSAPSESQLTDMKNHIEGTSRSDELFGEPSSGSTGDSNAAPGAPSQEPTSNNNDTSVSASIDHQRGSHNAISEVKSEPGVDASRPTSDQEGQTFDPTNEQTSEKTSEQTSEQQSEQKPEEKPEETSGQKPDEASASHSAKPTEGSKAPPQSDSQAAPQPSEHIKIPKPAKDPFPQRHTIVIPSYSSWFSMNRICEIEAESLPEFFTGKNRSKTPQVYGKYRNFMINAYRLNPSEYLTVTACRRNLVGDAATIMRVHHFLDEWGLINYQVDAEARPASVAPPFTGHWQVKYDVPRGTFPFQIYEGLRDPQLNPVKPRRTHYPSQYGVPGASGASNGNVPPVPNLSGATSGPSQSNLPHQGDFAAPQNRPNPSQAVPPASSAPDYGPQGIAEASVPGAEKLEAKVSAEEDAIGADNWTKEDTRRLLEAVERYPNNWDAVAAVMETDKATVVRKFVQQTTEDKFKDEELGPLKYNTNHIPFARSENPVLSVLSFLASNADPELVKAALGRTDKVIQEAAKLAEKQDEESETQRKEEEHNESAKKDVTMSESGEHQPGSDATADKKPEGDDSEKEKKSAEESNIEEVSSESRAEDSKPADSKPEEIKSEESKPDETKPEKPDTESKSTDERPSDDKSDNKPENRASFAETSAASLALAAARSRVFANNTERVMYDKYLKLLELEMVSIKRRLSKFSMLERALDTERREIDRERELLFLDRVHYRKNVEEAASYVQRAADAASSGNAEELKTMAAALKDRAEPEPPVRPIFVLKPQAETSDTNVSEEKPGSLNEGESGKFRMWTLQPRAV